MLAKRFRIAERKDFERVEKEGRIFQSKSFGLAYFNRNDNQPARFGFVISTKIAKEATKRNKAKRALAEVARLNLDNIKDGFDIVFLAKQTILNKSTQDITNEVERALFQAYLLK